MARLYNDEENYLTQNERKGRENMQNYEKVF